MATKNYSAKTVGNAEARPGKREAFRESKAERSGLADSIHAAFAQRGVWEDNEANIWNKQPDLDGIIKPRKFVKDAGSISRKR